MRQQDTKVQLEDNIQNYIDSFFYQHNKLKDHFAAKRKENYPGKPTKDYNNHQ